MALGSISRMVRCPACRRQHSSPVDGRKDRKAATACKRCGAPLKGGKTSYRARIRIGGVQEAETKSTLDEARTWLRKKRQQKVEIESGAVERKQRVKGSRLRIAFGDIEKEFLTWIEFGRDREPTLSADRV